MFIWGKRFSIEYENSMYSYKTTENNQFVILWYALLNSQQLEMLQKHLWSLSMVFGLCGSGSADSSTLKWHPVSGDVLPSCIPDNILRQYSAYSPFTNRLILSRSWYHAQVHSSFLNCSGINRYFSNVIILAMAISETVPDTQNFRSTATKISNFLLLKLCLKAPLSTEWAKWS